MAGENFRKVGFYGLAWGLVAFEWFFGASEGVRSIARGKFSRFEGDFGPKEGFYTLRRWKPGQTDDLYIYRGKIMQRNGSLCIWKIVRGG